MSEPEKPSAGGIVSMGAISLCHWSMSQSTVALSSGESELNAVVKAITEPLAVSNFQEEFVGCAPSHPSYGRLGVQEHFIECGHRSSQTHEHQAGVGSGRRGRPGDPVSEGTEVDQQL